MDWDWLGLLHGLGGKQYPEIVLVMYTRHLAWLVSALNYEHITIFFVLLTYVYIDYYILLPTYYNTIAGYTTEERGTETHWVFFQYIHSVKCMYSEDTDTILYLNG